MEWTDRELDELSAFFAKRLTPELSPLDPTDPPPPGDPAKPWRAKLERARDRGRLPSLARDIAGTLPDDANLQEACRLLQGGPRPQGNQLAWAAALASVLLFSGVAGAGLLSLSQSRAVEPLEPAETVAVRVEAEPTPLPDPDAGRLGTEDDIVLASAAPVASVDAEPSKPAEGAAEAPQAEQAPPPPAEAPNPTARCAGTSGEVVGYWYAGAKKPGKQGSKVKLDRTVNVRADYPDVHNGFDKKAAVQCVLMAGDRVKLEEPPIEVPGKAYWVPLVAGTLEAGA